VSGARDVEGRGASDEDGRGVGPHPLAEGEGRHNGSGENGEYTGRDSE
jgi:hypothetical protein